MHSFLAISRIRAVGFANPSFGVGYMSMSQIKNRSLITLYLFAFIQESAQKTQELEDANKKLTNHIMKMEQDLNVKL